MYFTLSVIFTTKSELKAWFNGLFRHTVHSYFVLEKKLVPLFSLALRFGFSVLMLSLTLSFKMADGMKGVDALQEELLRAKDKLKDVNENIKKLTGRDLEEQRCN